MKLFAAPNQKLISSPIYHGEQDTAKFS